MTGPRFGADITLDRDPEGWRDRLRAAVPGGLDVVFDPSSRNCGALMQPGLPVAGALWGGRHLVVGFVSRRDSGVAGQPAAAQGCQPW